MASKSLISLANIPVEDIYNYLTIVKGVSVRNENAVDTDRVDGIEASKIAKAATDENGNLVSNRDTVQNALQLGGIDAAQYLQRDESTTLLGDTYQVSTILSNELKELRDEIYQLKAELAKQGYVQQSKVYDGFYDAFKDGEIRYANEQVTTVVGEHHTFDTTITVANTSDLTVGEYIAIRDTEGNMYASRIEEINNNQITINKAFGVTVLNDTGVFKYAGSYYNGEYIFGKNTGSYISTDITKAIIKDGKDRTIIQVLGDTTKGFATKLSNYYSTYSTLIRKVEFSLAYTGNPGAIRASIWKMNIDSSKQNPTCELLGTSESVYPSSCSNTLSEVEFMFTEPVRISEGTTYLIALYAGGVDSTNTWKIGGYADAYDGVSSDLWYVDDTYYFDNNSFSIIPGATDAYLALHISEELNVNIRYNDTGLYTCEETIQGGFTRARVELRVNREGIFNVADSAPIATMSGNELKIIGEDANPFKKEDKVVVGNMISTLTGECTKDRIYMTDNIYSPVGADVYRVGYTVVAKCKRKVKDVPLEYDAPVIVELPLTSVMYGKEPNKEACSTDRLIFEAEIAPNESNRTLNTFDHIEVQVFWNSSLENGSINDKKQFAGKILDLSVVTDKSYNKANK